jgi:hypothetical protein
VCVMIVVELRLYGNSPCAPLRGPNHAVTSLNRLTGGRCRRAIVSGSKLTVIECSECAVRESICQKQAPYVASCLQEQDAI